MSSRNNNRFGRLLVLSVAVGIAGLAQPQPEGPATGNASVSGTVSNSVTGAPLPRAHVTVIIFGSTNAQSFNTVTNEEGKFTIGGLPPGRLILNVDRVGFITPATGNRFSGSQLQPDEKKEDLKLTLTPTGGISGRVLNAEGSAVQGAIVSLEGAPFGINPATTDEKGQFRISGVPPGRYRVSANPAVLPFPPEIRTDGTREVHYARTYYPDALTVKAGQRVEVGPGVDAMGIDIHLVRTPIVTLSGRVVDAPAGGKTVVRAVASAASGGGVQMANNVKADGSFQIWQLDPGKYTVVASNTTQGAGPPRGVQSIPVEIEVAGVDIEHLELRMIPPFDVSAQLRFDDAKARELPIMPVRQGPGQQAAQSTPPQPMPRRMSLRPEGPTFAPSMFQSVEIGADDSFTLEKLQPGRYRLTPMWSVYVKSVAIGNTQADGDVLDLRSGPAGAITVTLGSVTGEVSGVVSDSSGPAAGVRVAMVADRIPAGAPFITMSGADGAYKLGGVPPGNYKLIAGDNDLMMQIQPDRDAEEFAEMAESVEVRGGDKITKALNKKILGGRY